MPLFKHPFKRSIYLRVMVYSLLLLSIGFTQALVDILTLREMNQRNMALEQYWVQGATFISNMDYNVEAFRLAEIERALAFDPTERALAETEARRRQTRIDAFTARYAQLSPGGTAPGLAAFIQAWTRYKTDHAEWIADTPLHHGNGAALPGGRLATDATATSHALKALAAAHRAEGGRRAAAQAEATRRTTRFDIATILLCVLLALLTQLGAKRGIIAPLRAITEAMTRLAAGQRNTALPGLHRRDEIGAMAAACEIFRLNVVALDQAHEAARRAQDQAQLLARHDALTGLPNRRVFSTDLESALNHAGTGNHGYALLLIDLDDFKKVNDIQGHQAGDAVLCTIAQRLEAAVRKTDTLARLGGDEFAIITQTSPDMAEHLDQTQHLATRLLGIIRQPIEIGDTKAVIGASIGIVSFAGSNCGGDVISLLRAADIAMYRAKQSGRFTFRFFEQSMDDEMRAREALERDVVQALAEGAIRPHYQPLVDIGRHHIRGFEALARWTHPVRGPVMPDKFIPIIEQLGLTAELSSCILRHACRDARTWPADVCVAINISPHELKDETLPTRLLKILHEEDLAPHRLEVEITESALVSDLAAAKTILATLQEHGITICLDDFGTGYSSLYHLRELKFDKIKIDRSFVQAMRGSPESEKIIDAILGLTNSLCLPTVAEGIEDLPTLRMLLAKGCDLGQGFYFGKAMSAEAAHALLIQGVEAMPA